MDRWIATFATSFLQHWIQLLAGVSFPALPSIASLLALTISLPSLRLGYERGSAQHRDAYAPSTLKGAPDCVSITFALHLHRAHAGGEGMARHTPAPQLDFPAKGHGGDAMERNATSTSQNKNEISPAFQQASWTFKGSVRWQGNKSTARQNLTSWLFFKREIWQSQTVAAKLHPCSPEEHSEPICSGKWLTNGCEHFGSPASSHCIHKPSFSHSWSGEALGRNSSASREGKCSLSRCFSGTILQEDTARHAPCWASSCHSPGTAVPLRGGRGTEGGNTQFDPRK